MLQFVLLCLGNALLCLLRTLWIAICIRHCSVLQCVAVCCSVFAADTVNDNLYQALQCVAVWCSVLQCVAMFVVVWCSVAVCWRVWQCVLQWVAVDCSGFAGLQCVWEALFLFVASSRKSHLYQALQCVVVCVAVWVAVCVAVCAALCSTVFLELCYMFAENKITDSVVQRLAECCSELPWVAVCCSVLQCIAMCVAGCCSLLSQPVAICGIVVWSCVFLISSTFYRKSVCVSVCVRVCVCANHELLAMGVATISWLLEIIGLFCKRAL